MATTFNLIKTANTQLVELRNEVASICEAFSAIAKERNVSVQHLAESVTHILANIAQTAQAGKPIRLMHLNSVAAFMAGVDAIAQGLPNAKDQDKKRNTIRALAVAAIGPDGEINDATFPIIDLGARKEDLKTKYAALLQNYVRNPKNGQELSLAARQLQLAVDRAMRSDAKPRSFAPAGGAHDEVATQSM